MRIVYKITNELDGRYYIGKHILPWNTAEEVMENWWRIGIVRNVTEKYFNTTLDNVKFELLECYATYTSMEQVYEVYLKNETDINKLAYGRMRDWFKRKYNIN